MCRVTNYEEHLSQSIPYEDVFSRDSGKYQAFHGSMHVCLLPLWAPGGGGDFHYSTGQDYHHKCIHIQF